MVINIQCFSVPTKVGSGCCSHHEGRGRVTIFIGTHYDSLVINDSREDLDLFQHVQHFMVDVDSDGQFYDLAEAKPTLGSHVVLRDLEGAQKVR